MKLSITHIHVLNEGCIFKDNTIFPLKNNNNKQNVHKMIDSML